ncbi:MAG: hypothetical protein G01um101425_210 [Candidatus Peregrinibacteria bacterium Gr01-1014_25]|nr:MAG: hypothetical protein G01um101425_210 [Candidatus Peregrinibacteria bacterium Gr01-1014_25]
MSSQLRFTTVVFLAFVGIVTVAQTVIRGARLDALANRPKPPPVPCRGESIAVDDDFNGGSLKPWSCKAKCAEKKEYYLLYHNGVATQCGAYPDCFDEGEDKGLTCIPQLKTTKKK